MYVLTKVLNQKKLSSITGKIIILRKQMLQFRNRALLFNHAVYLEVASDSRSKATERPNTLQLTCTVPHGSALRQVQTPLMLYSRYMQGSHSK